MSYIITEGSGYPDRDVIWGNRCSVPALCRKYADRKKIPESQVDGIRFFKDVSSGDLIAEECFLKSSSVPNSKFTGSKLAKRRDKGCRISCDSPFLLEKCVDPGLQEDLAVLLEVFLLKGFHICKSIVLSELRIFILAELMEGEKLYL